MKDVIYLVLRTAAGGFVKVPISVWVFSLTPTRPEGTFNVQYHSYYSIKNISHFIMTNIVTSVLVTQLYFFVIHHPSLPV